MNRTICSIFEEMRKAHETRNYSYLPGLIEEAQSAANRMEAGLYDKHDLNRAREEYKELKAELKTLKKQVADETAKCKGKGSKKTTRSRDASSIFPGSSRYRY